MKKFDAKNVTGAGVRSRASHRQGKPDLGLWVASHGQMRAGKQHDDSSVSGVEASTTVVQHEGKTVIPSLENSAVDVGSHGLDPGIFSLAQEVAVKRRRGKEGIAVRPRSMAAALAGLTPPPLPAAQEKQHLRRLAVDIPDALHQKILSVAKRRNSSVRDDVAALLEWYYNDK